jgi:hypothetical protein
MIDIKAVELTLLDLKNYRYFVDHDYWMHMSFLIPNFLIFSKHQTKWNSYVSRASVASSSWLDCCFINRIFVLKGPKLEIFGSRVLTQIRPVWVGDLRTRQKIQNFDVLGLKIVVLYSLVLWQTSLKNFRRCRRRR